MSVTKVLAADSAAGATAYIVLGRGDEKAEHLAERTDRLAASRFDMSPNEFVALAERLAHENRRKTQLHHYIQAFSPEELDKDNTDDVQLAADLGYALSRKMHPNSPCLVAVHVDSSSGHIHSHILTVNHDFESGKALRRFRRHSEVAIANDELMLEHGMRTIENPASKSWSPVAAPFDDLLRGRIREALADPSVIDLDSWAAALAKRGIEVAVTVHKVATDARRGKARGDDAFGLTFRMLDESTPGTAPRIRRRKGSRLGQDLAFDGVMDTLRARGLRPSLSPTDPDLLARNRKRATARASLAADLDGILARGLYAAMPGGWIGACGKIGVSLLRGRLHRDLTYARGGDEWGVEDLGDRFSAVAVAEHAADVAALRQIAPPGSDHLEVAELVAVIEQHRIDADEVAVPRQRQRRAFVPDVSPARERHLSF
ncbi:relaxase/mobilization nuclease domain-containing protein [Cryobacterium sp. RTS3]|uniref:relaxase/mobilization nuclease domain-containing protein n=1 Tax=Cryobacterium sp. RTS3 TaxID=3048643 RepID=UPI002B228279|nr:relaxase/mobilization nuclease domain-containing protein [Cryobacterium sp. RTS3]MEA9998809.1 relaxase/mobilization nuclease domain-containing protein [Cryobacterium sp. RTS3]